MISHLLGGVQTAFLWAADVLICSIFVMRRMRTYTAHIKLDSCPSTCSPHNGWGRSGFLLSGVLKKPASVIARSEATWLSRWYSMSEIALLSPTITRRGLFQQALSQE